MPGNWCLLSLVKAVSIVRIAFEVLGSHALNDVRVSIVRVTDACQVAGAYCQLMRQSALSRWHIRH